MSTELAHEVVPDDELVYCVELPTLQQMASYQVSLSVWYSYVTTPRHFLWSTQYIYDAWLPYLGVKTTHQRDMDKLIEELRTPRPIEEMLKKAATKIRQELNDWVKHLSNDLFPDVMQECSIVQVDSRWCVWTTNGEIDYRKSAEKMLNSGQLNDVQKFVVWSKYCMEDRVKTISLESLPECVENVAFDKDPVLFYWICYLKNEVHKVPKTSPEALDVSMARKCHGGRRMAMEYFWNRSLNDSYHIYAHLLVFNCVDSRSWCIFERLFSSADSNSSASSYRIREKVIGSMIYSRSSPYPLRLWSHFKHLITDESFAKFVIKILEHALGVEEKMNLLIDVWNAADDHHKDYTVLTSCTLSILRIFVRPWPEPPCSAAFEFLSNYITHLYSKPEGLNDIYIPHLLTCVPDLDCLNKIMSLYSHSREFNFTSRMKKCTLESREFLQFVKYSFKYVSYDHLDAKLEWLCSDAGPDAVRENKKKILQSVPRSSTICHRLLDFDKLKKLFYYIDETYAEETSQAFELKQNFIQALFFYCFERPHFFDGLDTIKKIVETVYSPEQLRDFKNKFFAKFSAMMKTNSYWWYEEISYETFESVIDWCCGNDRVQISLLKKKVPRGALVTAVLNRLLVDNVFELRRPILAEILLDRVQKHLVWYLGDENNVNEYKLRRINSCSKDLKIFKKLLMENESCLMVTLKWFFNGNETLATEFRSKTNLNLP